MSRSIHIKVDDKTYEEWQQVGATWHGVRAKIMRRKVREVIDEVRKNPIYMKDVQKKEESK